MYTKLHLRAKKSRPDPDGLNGLVPPVLRGNVLLCCEQLLPLSRASSMGPDWWLLAGDGWFLILPLPTRRAHSQKAALEAQTLRCESYFSSPVYGADVEMTPRSHARLTKTLNNHNLAIELKWCDSGIIGFENGDNTNSKTNLTFARHVYPHWKICFSYAYPTGMTLSSYASVIILEQIQMKSQFMEKTTTVEYQIYLTSHHDDAKIK